VAWPQAFSTTTYLDSLVLIKGALLPLRSSMTPVLLLLHLFNGPFSRTTWVSRYHKGKTSLDLNEARDDEVLGCNGISWTICKQCAPLSRQITTPAPHHSIFYRPDALPDTQPTVPKHWGGNSVTPVPALKGRLWIAADCGNTDDSSAQVAVTHTHTHTPV